MARLLEHLVFAAGDCWTSFIDDNPELLTPELSLDRDHKFLRFLADAYVNGSRIKGQVVRGLSFVGALSFQNTLTDKVSWP